MPFDVFGWSPNTSTGFGGYQTSNRFPQVFGYDDQGNAVSNQAQMNQITQQRMNPQPSQSGPMPNQDFFSALAGLMGGGPGNKPNPAMQKPAGYNLGQQIAQYEQAANRPTIITPGGQGPYGGVSPEGQRQMFEGTARAWGNFGQQQQSARPSTSRGPSFAGQGNGLFQMRGGSASNRWGNVGNPSGVYGGFR
jgi:hypothetical protein